MSEEKLYTKTEIEAVASLAAHEAIASLLNLDNDIEQGEKGLAVSSKYRKTYYYIKQDGNVGKVRIGGENEKDADRRFSLFCQSSKTNIPTLKEFVMDIYKPKFLPRLAPNTISSYTTYLDRYILPNLGSKKLDKITVVDIQDLYDWMAIGKKHGCKNNINAGTINRVSGLLGRIFRIAIDMNYISSSPIKKTLLANEGEEAKHHEPLADSEVARIKAAISYLPTEQMQLYMGLLAYTGMRREEIVGLGWEHICLEECYGHIERVVTYPNGGKTVIRNKTKTKYSTRDFIIPGPLADILAKYWRKEGYIIHGKDPSKPVAVSTLKRLYTKAFKILGISEHDNHDWRTTFGTQLKESGVSSAQVADLLGHADTRMVETVYARRRREGIFKCRAAVEALNRGTNETP